MFASRRWFLPVVIILIIAYIPAAAQTAERAILSPPTLDEFPNIHAYLEVFNADGNFTHGLDPDDIKVIEDDMSVSVEELEEQEVGAQFLIALNQGASFAIRDSNGISRFDILRETLTSWAETHSSEFDDLSFLSNDGVEYLHLKTGREWLSKFQAFEPDFRAANPTLDVLLRAVEIASEPQSEPGKGRSILLLTPPPETPSTATFQNIIAMAAQENIRIHVWMVSSTESFNSQGAEQLAELARQTGGSFFAFSGDEAVPDTNTYLEPLRYVYRLSYESGIRNSDPHRMFVRIKYNNTQIESEIHQFDFQILPPNPIFVSPPLEISRENIASLSDTLSEINQYTPESQELEILIEFPDGHPRPLVRTTLYDNGIAVEEKTSEPFDRITWNLNPYERSSRHILKVEVVDSLGLRNSTIDQAVQITVKQSPQKIISTLIDNAPIIAGASAALAGSVLLLVLVINGHIQPRRFARRKKRRTKKEVLQLERTFDNQKDTTVQPLSTGRKIMHWVDRFHLRPRHSQSSIKPSYSEIVAYLEYIETNGKGKKSEPIPVKVGETSFGKDPTKATMLLEDNAMNDLHARMVVKPDGTCLLFDENSIAGTWLNYQPVSLNGEQVHHGDIVHIGRIGLSYRITNKALIPKPVVHPVENRS